MLPSYPQHLKYAADEKLTNFYLYTEPTTCFPLQKKIQKMQLLTKIKLLLYGLLLCIPRIKISTAKKNHYLNYLKNDFDSKLDALT